MKLQIMHIASNHVDFMCRKCCTAFELREDDYVQCPNCYVTDEELEERFGSFYPKGTTDKQKKDAMKASFKSINKLVKAVKDYEAEIGNQGRVDDDDPDDISA